jgi:hypothetical protein
MIRRKDDSEEIEAFIKGLPQQTRLDSARSWWPQFVFHFTHLDNAVSALKLDCLYSRHQMEERDIPFWDSASPEMIGRTSEQDKDFVRFFFRPRTPTQYVNEGIRTQLDIQMGAHCPVPVFLLFDSIDLLTRANCNFSNKSIAKTFFGMGDDAGYLRSLPFHDIYHEGSIPLSRRDEIKARRHAEVLFPQELDLSGLREIHCRSRAEKDTFLHLLTPHLREKWRDKVFSDGRRNLFFKRWTYIDTVSLGRSHINIEFSPDTKSPGPFQAKFAITDPVSNRTTNRIEDNYLAKGSQVFGLSKELEDYTFAIELDGNRVYENSFHQDYNLPF